VPRNKEIMRVFRDLEIVEQLGSGIPRILKSYGRDAFEIRKSFVRIIFHYEKPFDVKKEPQMDLGAQVDLDILKSCSDQARSSAEIARSLGHKQLSGNIRKALARLRQKGFLGYTLPEKPNSRLQQYRITEKGRTLIRK
jgi:predicted HTH transcriptional regulator